mmetsp:Transcript_508/g.1098  ORF Transcript_508/g.1098 Transcript_508/m.1098 type:complete len:201 (-) Transcript_508:72-674(-)
MEPSVSGTRSESASTPSPETMPIPRDTPTGSLVLDSPPFNPYPSLLAADGTSSSRSGTSPTASSETTSSDTPDTSTPSASVPTVPSPPPEVRTTPPCFGTSTRARDSTASMPDPSSTDSSSAPTDTGCVPPPKTRSRSGTSNLRSSLRHSDRNNPRSEACPPAPAWPGPPMDPPSLPDTPTTSFVSTLSPPSKSIMIAGC